MTSLMKLIKSPPYRRWHEVGVVRRCLMLVEDRWGARSPSLQCSRGTLSASPPTTSQVTSLLPASKTFTSPRWWYGAISWWKAFSRPNISLSPGQEIYPERKLMKPTTTILLVSPLLFLSSLSGPKLRVDHGCREQDSVF